MKFSPTKATGVGLAILGLAAMLAGAFWPSAAAGANVVNMDVLFHKLIASVCGSTSFIAGCLLCGLDHVSERLDPRGEVRAAGDRGVNKAAAGAAVLVLVLVGVVGIVAAVARNGGSGPMTADQVRAQHREAIDAFGRSRGK